MKTQGKKALLVGVNSYTRSGLNNLKFAVNDVSSIYDILTDTSRGGFAPDNCILMMDKGRKKDMKPTRSDLMSQMESLSRTATRSDYLLFFFSGHGIEEDGKSYLCLSDARCNVLRNTAVSVDWIRAKLKASKAHSKVLILDACHAGAMKGKAESGRMTKGLQDSFSPVGEGFATLASCKLNEISYEMPEKKHGVFSYFLIEGLKGAADFDSDGHILLSEISRYTAEKTTEWTFKKPIVQTPNLKSEVVGDLLLVDVPRLEDKKTREKVKEVRQDFSDLTAPISRITIHPSYLPKEKRGALVATILPNLSTYLLKHFALDEIKYAKGICVFPLGEFREDPLKISLEYNPEELKKIEDILIKSASLLQAKYIVYRSLSLFDIRKIAKFLKKTKWKVRKWNPKIFSLKKGQNCFLEIELNFPELKQIPELRFFNYFVSEEKETIITITERGKKILDEKTMQILKPTKFLRLLGDVWKHK